MCQAPRRACLNPCCAGFLEAWGICVAACSAARAMSLALTTELLRSDFTLPLAGVCFQRQHSAAVSDTSPVYRSTSQPAGWAPPLSSQIYLEAGTHQAPSTFS